MKPQVLWALLSVPRAGKYILICGERADGAEADNPESG